MKIKDALRLSKKIGVADTTWLLLALLKITRSQLLLMMDSDLGTDALQSLKEAILRREKGEPLQYIVGEANFYGRDFLVNGSVLIPRPETERLVEIALSMDCLRRNPKPKILDIGTGSGVIGVTLKKEIPAAIVFCTDVSALALKVAQKNAQRLAAEIQFKRGNKVFGALKNMEWDLVISNPPYVSKVQDWVSKEVSKWEPELALYPSSKDRIKIFKNPGTFTAHKILEQCAEMKVKCTAFELSARVAYVLERHWKKHERVAKIYREADFNQRKRFLIVEWKYG